MSDAKDQIPEELTTIWYPGFGLQTSQDYGEFVAYSDPEWAAGDMGAEGKLIRYVRAPEAPAPTPSPEFSHGSYSLHDAIDGLMAYDGGCWDSGIHDESLRASVKAYFESLDETAYRVVLAKHAQWMLSDRSIEQGYGLSNVKGFIEWMEELGFYI